ncbi:putative chloramphenical resistance permease RarD [Shewanella putrefaciens]|nr:putative chloramphenical resistance permease RarD [Shewanella putrefaciens]
MKSAPNTLLGVSLNVAASALFAIMFAYTALLDALSGEEIYGWRILFTMPMLTLFILVRGYWSQVIVIYQRVIHEKHFWLTRIASSFLIGIQLWLFMWAPGNGYGLAVSLGYFIMPITMVLVGRFAFNDKMSKMQWIACLLALLGVVNQVGISQTLTWPTLAICLGYPIYFWLRHKTDTNNIGGVWFDMLLSVPFCIYFILNGGYVIGSFGESSLPLWLAIGLGAISALALGLQSLSAPHLNLSLFGLLIYVEPLLLLVVAIMLGETISRSEWPTYIGIWFAVIVLMLEGGLKIFKSRNF